MGFEFIRHSAVDLRRINMDRAPKDLDVRERTSERLDEAGESQCQVRQEMRHDTWMTIVKRHVLDLSPRRDCQSRVP